MMWRSRLENQSHILPRLGTLFLKFDRPPILKVHLIRTVENPISSSSKKCYPTIIQELCHQFSLQDLRKSTNNFDEALKLGGGSFGYVYKGCLEHNGTSDYAIALRRNSNHGFGAGAFTKEIELLCQLRHPNLVSLIGFCNDKGEKILVYEYIPNGSLLDYLHNKNMEPMSWKTRLEICIGIARGLHYLHSGLKRTIFHLNIKPCNILLNNNMVPKLFDFGFSFIGPSSNSKPKRIEVEIIAGTYGYMAPEYFIHRTLTDKCDVFSFGIVLLLMVCIGDNRMVMDKANMLANQSRYLDLPGCCPLSLALYIFSTKFPVEEIIDPTLKGKIAPECWQVYGDITQRCLRYEADERPTMGEVEALLEDALSRQEEADMAKTDGDYTLLSATFIDEQPYGSNGEDADSSYGGYSP